MRGFLVNLDDTLEARPRADVASRQSGVRMRVELAGLDGRTHVCVEGVVLGGNAAHRDMPAGHQNDRAVPDDRMLVTSQGRHRPWPMSPCGAIEELEIGGAGVLSRARRGGNTPLPDYWAELANHVRGLGDEPACAVRHPTLT